MEFQNPGDEKKIPNVSREKKKSKSQSKDLVL